MTITECRKRRRIFKEMLFHFQRGECFDLNAEQLGYLQLALKRSVEIEEFNILELKGNTKGENV